MTVSPWQRCRSLTHVQALAYYYVRALVHRPAVGSNLGAKAAPALLATVDSSKHIIQIIQLLEERSMSFSFCLNKTDVLTLCCMTLLYQSLELKHDSKLMKDIERLTNAVLKTLQKAIAPGICDLKRVAKMLIMVGDPPQPASAQRSPGMTTMAAPQRTSPPASTFKKGSPYGRHTVAAMSEMDLLSQQQKLRRMTMPGSAAARSELYRTQSPASFDRTDQSSSRRDHRFSISHTQQAMMRASSAHKANSNMDYMSLGNNAASNPQPPSPNQTHIPPSRAIPPSHQPQTPLYPPSSMHKGVSAGGVTLGEWEALLGAMDGGQINVYDAMYGGPALSLETPTSAATHYTEWAADPWDLSGFHIGDLDLSTTSAAGPQSVLSLSDDSLSTTEDLSNEHLYLGVKGEDYRSGGLLPHRNSHDGPLGLEGLDMSLVL